MSFHESRLTRLLKLLKRSGHHSVDSEWLMEFTSYSFELRLQLISSYLHWLTSGVALRFTYQPKDENKTGRAPRLTTFECSESMPMHQVDSIAHENQLVLTTVCLTTKEASTPTRGSFTSRAKSGFGKGMGCAGDLLWHDLHDQTEIQAPSSASTMSSVWWARWCSNGLGFGSVESVLLKKIEAKSPIRWLNRLDIF